MRSTAPIFSLISPALAGALALAAVLTPLPIDAAPRATGRSSLNPSAHLDLTVEQLDLLERRIHLLQGAIEGRPMSRSPAEVKDLLFEANFAFLTEDYVQASLLYFSLLENGDLDSHASKADAEYYLAESLFLGRNYYPAQAAYQEIVSVGAIHPHYDDSVMKLIEIFGFTGDVDQFNYYYNNFLQTTRAGSGAGALRVRYALGKTLYRQGKLADAKQMFANFPKGSTFTAQARYHYGEILVKEGYAAFQVGDAETASQIYRSAVPVFEDVVQLPVSTDEQTMVLHLAWIALGTLHYELDNLQLAIEAYQNVPQDSEFFADALVQICWAYIRLGVLAASDELARPEDARRVARENFQRAYRTIDLFLLAFPEDTREAELKLLMAHLQVKLEEYQEALDDYESVVDDFDAIRARLNHIVESDIDPMVYFNQLVDETFIVEAEYQVPELAARMARQDPRLNEAVKIASDLQHETREIDASQETVARLEEALRTERTGEMMTTYRARRQEIDGFDARVLSMESDLVFIEANYLIDALGGERAAGVREIVTERAALGSRVNEVSSLYTDRTEYREDLESAGRAIDTEAFKLEANVDDTLARLAGVELYLKNELAIGNMTDSEVQGHKLELDSIRKELTDASEMIQEIHNRMDPRRITARVVADDDSGEQSQRKSVRAGIASLVERLVDFRSGVSRGSANEFFAKVDDARSRLRRQRTVCGALMIDLDRRETEEIAEISRLLDEEKRALLAYSGEADGYGRDSRAVSGEIAETSFQHVQELFADTVMQADMGAIDVYWRQKEDITEDTATIRAELKDTLNQLKHMYEGLLEFEDDEEEEDEGVTVQ